MHAGRFARAGVFAGLLAGALTVGCKPKLEPTAPQPLADTAAAEPLAPAPPPAATIALATAPTQLLPEGTGLLVSLASVRHLLRIVDLPALIAKFRPQYDIAVNLVEQGIGHNLLDPAKWPEIGVDPDGPLGGALFNTDAEAGCLFFTLSDPLRFREFLDRLGGRIGGNLVPLFEDRGLVLGSEDGKGSLLVLRDSFAFFVLVGRPDRAPFDYARQIASIDPAHGLTATLRWQKALGASPGPHDLFAFVDIGGMIAGEAEARRRRADSPEPNWVDTELQRLREQGAPVEELVRWEKMADEQRLAEAQSRERQRRQEAFLSALFDPMGPLVFQFGLSDQAVSGTIHVAAPETALPRKIFRGSGPPHAITRAAGRVLFGASAYLDVAEALLALDALLTAEGESLDKLFAEFQRGLGIDPRVLLGVLDGQVSFAWTLDGPLSFTDNNNNKAQGFSLALGLKNSAEAQALVDLLALRLPAPLRVGRDAKTRGLLITNTHWRDVHVALVGNHLTLSTDRTFARRFARDAPSQPAKLQPAGAAALVTTDATGALFMDYLGPIGLFAARSTSDFRYDPSSNQPYWRFPDTPHPQIDAVPHSPAYKSKLREWKAVDAKVRKLDDQREHAQALGLQRVAESVGSLAFNLRETPEGLRAEGGHYFGPGGLTRVIEHFADSTPPSGDVPTWALHEKRSHLETEAQEIRVRDLEKALGIPASSN